MATAELANGAAMAPRHEPSEHKGVGRRLLEAFEAFEQFPALVGACGQIFRARQGSRIDTEVIAAVESDLALTVAILRRANAGAAGGRRVGTVPEALARVGREGLCEIVGSISSFDLLERSGPWGGAPQSHRVHAVATQRAAHRVAAAVAYDRVDELFVTALLHDVGKLVLAYVDPRYAELGGDPALTPEVRLERERRAMGIDHALVGGVLARRWGLPQELARAIERHHDPAESGLVAMVRLADMIARYEAGNAVSGARMEEAAAKVGLAPAALRSLLCSAPSGERRPSVPSPLTRSEQRVVAELGKGLVYKQIAHQLGLSVSTVRTHLYNTYRKLGVSDRAQAILLAKEHNWI
jgi:putative nucleotidyltransferase with HDIG domain